MNRFRFVLLSSHHFTLTPQSEFNSPSVVSYSQLFSSTLRLRPLVYEFVDPKNSSGFDFDLQLRCYEADQPMTGRRAEGKVVVLAGIGGKEQ